MAYTTINKSTDYFNTLLWTGNSGNQSITGNDFTADFTWSKTRSNAESHVLMDTVRDAGTTLNQSISSNTANAEGTLNNSSTLTVNSTGFDLAGTSGGTLNFTGYTYASWLWRAGGHTGTSNTDGSITSTVSANTTSGFSIVKWTANLSSAETVGHGLGTAPKVIIQKAIDQTSGWVTGGFGLDWSGYLTLNTTAAFDNDSNDSSGTGRFFSAGGTEPSSTVFSTNSSALTGSATDIIAYCFAEKKGYSKFSSFIGNGSTDGPMIYTGFKPAWFLWKRTDSAANWNLVDSKRAGYNVANYRLFPDANGTEDTQERVNLLSNGIKLTTTDVGSNASGGTYIYMAFAEAPLVGSNNVPCTAR